VKIIRQYYYPLLDNGTLGTVLSHFLLHHLPSDYLNDLLLLAAARCMRLSWGMSAEAAAEPEGSPLITALRTNVSTDVYGPSQIPSTRSPGERSRINPAIDWRQMDETSHQG
jgi:hypothetical protein